MSDNFGMFLVEKRKQLNLTQKELAEKLFVTESAVSKWEKGRARPDISLLSKLAEILKVSEHELLQASEDFNERRKTKDAKKWRNLSNAINLIFIISYSIALLTCFIVNLAVNKTLSWFFIVFFSIMLSASLTTLPRHIKKFRLLALTIIPYLCLILLLGTCCIYIKGYWFMLAFSPITYIFIVIFLPLYIHYYKFPKFIKNNNLLFSVLVDIAITFLLLLSLSLSTGGNWFSNFAVYLILYSMIVPLTFVCTKYLKISKLFKASIILFVISCFLFGAIFVVKELMFSAFNFVINIEIPNFYNWENNDIRSANVCTIILGILLILSFIFLIVGIRKKVKKK